MKRTLLLTTEYPPDYGGIASYYSRLAAALPSDQFKVIKINQHWALAWLKILKFRRFFRYELIMVGQILPLGYPALFVRWLLGVPFAVFVHGLDLLRPQKNSWKHFWVKFILRRAAFVVANSEWTKSKAIQCGAEARRVSVVYPCVANSVTLRQAQGDNSKILAVARLVPRKGIDVLIRALPIVRSAHPTATLDVVGDGPERQRLEFLSESLNLNDAVHFFGSVSNEELSRRYESVTLFALPTRETIDDAEGFGLVFLEAASHGLSVVAGRGGGVGETVIDGVTGIMVDPTDPEAVAHAIIRLLSDQNLRNALGTAGRARAQKEFTAEESAKRIMILCQA